MPKFLQDFIKSLSPVEADELWEWLDASPDAISDLIAVAADRADVVQFNNILNKG